MLEQATDAFHPEIWVFGQLLGAIGQPDDSATALGLAGGAGFLGMGFRYGREDVSTLHLSGWNPFQSDLPSAATRLGAVGTLDETTRRRRAAKTLAAAVATGAPFALWLDTAAVGLAPAATEGASPGVVVATPAGDGASLTLSDGRGSVDRGIDDVARARGIHTAQRHRLLQLRPPSEADEAAALRTGLARLAVGATGGVASDRGPEGVHQLAAAIGGEGARPWSTVFEGDRHLLGALIAFHAAITREQGLLRGLQARFERRAAEVLERPELAERAEAHAELAAGWLAAAELALPGDVPSLALARGLEPAGPLPPALEADPMPLTASEQEELLTGLSGAVAVLAGAEEDALDAMRALLRRP